MAIPANSPKQKEMANPLSHHTLLPMKWNDERRLSQRHQCSHVRYSVTSPLSRNKSSAEKRKGRAGQGSAAASRWAAGVWVGWCGRVGSHARKKTKAIKRRWFFVLGRQVSPWAGCARGIPPRLAGRRDQGTAVSTSRRQSPLGVGSGRRGLSLSLARRRRSFPARAKPPARRVRPDSDATRPAPRWWWVRRSSRFGALAVTGRWWFGALGISPSDAHIPWLKPHDLGY